MALFVVACGLLLMTGGAVSLLLGFDIVLTERGSAMTIGGVVALSGGVISVGVGMALRRLNQILTVLDARTGRPVRNVSSDRPVLPFGGEQTEVPAATGTSDRLETPPPVRGTADTAAGAMLPGMATAGIAAGAAVIGASTVFGRAHGHDADPHPEEAGILTAEDHSWSDDRSALSGEPSAGREVWSGQPTPPSPLALPQDLEEELSRALAETTVLPEAEQAGDRSFEDGLSALLDSPSPALTAEAAPEPVYGAEPVHGDELADQHGTGDIAARQSGLEEVVARWPDQVDESSATARIVPEGRAADPVEDIAAGERPFDLVEPLQEGGPKVEEPPTTPMWQRDEDLFADLQPKSDEPGVPVAAAAPETPVLGTYAIGGRTYRMFADGAVEAVSEHGEVERFASMDALRKHLAGA